MKQIFKWLRSGAPFLDIVRTVLVAATFIASLHLGERDVPTAMAPRAPAPAAPSDLHRIERPSYPSQGSEVIYT